MHPDPQIPRCEPDGEPGSPPPPAPSSKRRGVGGEAQTQREAPFPYTAPHDPELSRRAARAPVRPGREERGAPAGGRAALAQPGRAPALRARRRCCLIARAAPALPGCAGTASSPSPRGTQWARWGQGARGAPARRPGGMSPLFPPPFPAGAGTPPS